MNCPGNGIYVVQGEMTSLLTAMKKVNRWSSHSHQDEENDILIRSFTDLKDVLSQIGDLRELDPNHVLGPFLEVIRSEETTGPVTSLALSSVNKFLSYGLIDPKCKSIVTTVENIADAVTHAKFVGTDQTSDAVVLMKILQVLRTLMLSPEGIWLTNESICEILLSCFRISFEPRLNELLRKCAENCLKDMVQLLFTRLPSFSEDLRKTNSVKQKLKMQTTGPMEPGRGKRKTRTSSRNKTKKVEDKLTSGSNRETSPTSKVIDQLIPSSNINTTLPVVNNSKLLDMQGSIHTQEFPSPLSSPDQQNSLSILPQEVNSEQFASVPLEGSNTPSVLTSSSDVFPTKNEELPVHSTIEKEKVVESAIIPRSDGVVISIEDSYSTVEELQDPARLEEFLDLTSPPPPPPPPTTGEICDVESHQKEENHQQHDGSLSQEVVQLPVTETTSVQEIAVTTQQVDPQSPTTMESGHDIQDWVNQQGVRFTASDDDSSSVSGPYGLVSIHELLRFVVSLINPTDKQNTETMINTGLALLTIALEVAADNMARYPSLMAIIKDDLCKNLFSLLHSERLPVFSAVLQVSFLLFESLRTHLKFQLEYYLTRLTEIIVSDSSKISFEHREIALESLVQMWRIPGLVTELYLNYDCALYCPNLYEELTNLLSKNAFPVTGVYNTHLLSLDALLTVIDSIESHCNSRILNERHNSVKGEASFKDPPFEHPSNYILRTGTRQKLSVNIPSHEQLMAVKRKKKLLATGTEHFNSKPKKGIQFLQEHNLMSNPVDPIEVVNFLRENPHLDKKMIGEYISNRANLTVLDAFVKSFDFTDMRIDEALRLYLETFRLPGESPLISLVMEHFADHWHKCNGEPFADADAAFTLAYAVIMLNVDQHNHNAKKQNNPMSAEAFKRNLKNVNGGQDFDEDMLDDVYNSIRNDEIVMPAEQTGPVKENYLWKVLLRRGNSKDGIYIHSANGLLDHDLFSLIWGPTVTALSSLFDKTNDPAIYQKAISGFRKCAMISAHYGMSNDFDNLIVSLCKFTMLHHPIESPDNLTISFGANPKSRLAAKTVFNLAHRHGDIIRDSWRNILDCILQLYRCKLLPKILVEAEDFIELSGKISLVREDIQLNPKTETGILSSLYLYMTLGAETNTQKGPSAEDQEAIRIAQNCIRECHLEQLITESKFLRLDSLQYFVKALVTASYGPEGHVSLGSSYSEDTAVFFLELLLKVVIQNRDRIGTMWSTVREHIYTLLMGAAACDHHFLVERSVVGLLRLAIRLMHREEMSPMVLQSLRMLLLLKGSTLSRVGRQVSYGMYELVKTSAANIHSAADWAIIFTLLECVGAGARPPRVVYSPLQQASQQGAKSEGEVQVDSGLGNERGYTSDSELSKAGSLPISPTNSGDVPLTTPTGWILVGREGEIQPVTLGGRVPPPDFPGENELGRHDPYSTVKCCDTLAFLVRDVAHITPYNFHNCLHCVRTFVHAIAQPNERRYVKKQKETGASKTSRKKVGLRKKEERAQSPTGNAYDADESDPEETPGYQQVCIQLLDLMHTLHTRAAQIFKWWSEETNDLQPISLWAQAWCPLLQGIARLAAHPNRQVRMSAVTYLQRALLVPDLQALTGEEWESCFSQVLFPLLTRLLEPAMNAEGIEETRMRAATVLSKVFLHHLTPLQTLPSFAQLWLTILDFMDKYMHADNSDLLFEAIPESLKNLLLVMDSAGVFTGQDGRNEIWVVTWDRIHSFLPHLQEEIFKEHPHNNEIKNQDVEESNKPETTIDHPQPVASAAATIINPVLVQVAQITASVPSITTQPAPPHCCTTAVPVQPVLKPGEAVEISGPTTSLITPQNWQPPAPVFPHMGHMISTPIGPANNVPLPIYAGFAALPQQQHTSSPGAQFFYQDVNQVMAKSSPIIPSNVSADTSSLLVSATGLLENTSLPQLPVISPPTST
uniref:Putative guanine nucleotide exchange factor n=2 Tax=Triatominae TaxID=70999 RepID=A0A224X4T3_9HEMI